MRLLKDNTTRLQGLAAFFRGSILFTAWAAGAFVFASAYLLLVANQLPQAATLVVMSSVLFIVVTARNASQYGCVLECIFWDKASRWILYALLSLAALFDAAHRITELQRRVRSELVLRNTQEVLAAADRSLSALSARIAETSRGLMDRSRALEVTDFGTVDLKQLLSLFEPDRRALLGTKAVLGDLSRQIGGLQLPPEVFAVSPTTGTAVAQRISSVRQAVTASEEEQARLEKRMAGIDEALVNARDCRDAMTTMIAIETEAGHWRGEFDALQESVAAFRRARPSRGDETAMLRAFAEVLTLGGELRERYDRLRRRRDASKNVIHNSNSPTGLDSVPALARYCSDVRDLRASANLALSWGQEEDLLEDAIEETYSLFERFLTPHLGTRALEARIARARATLVPEVTRLEAMADDLKPWRLAYQGFLAKEAAMLSPARILSNLTLIPDQETVRRLPKIAALLEAVVHERDILLGERRLRMLAELTTGYDRAAAEIATYDALASVSTSEGPGTRKERDALRARLDRLRQTTSEALAFVSARASGLTVYGVEVPLGDQLLMTIGSSLRRAMASHRSRVDILRRDVSATRENVDRAVAAALGLHEDTRRIAGALPSWRVTRGEELDALEGRGAALVERIGSIERRTEQLRRSLQDEAPRLADLSTAIDAWVVVRAMAVRLGWQTSNRSGTNVDVSEFLLTVAQLRSAGELNDGLVSTMAGTLSRISEVAAEQRTMRLELRSFYLLIAAALASLLYGGKALIARQVDRIKLRRMKALGQTGLAGLRAIIADPNIDMFSREYAIELISEMGLRTEDARHELAAVVEVVSRRSDAAEQKVVALLARTLTDVERRLARNWLPHP
jgi:hypothetical protein